MIENAMSRSEAKEVCGQNLNLVGKPLVVGEEEQGIIECVAVSPADDINKWIFLQRYAECRDAEASLDFYHVPYFDVVLIVRDSAGKLRYYDLQAVL